MLRVSQLTGFGAGRRAAAIVASGLQCHLDVGNPASYPGSGQDWTDLINGYVFNLGATNGAEGSDPSYNAGPPAYFSFDGGDFFKQSAAYSGSIMRKLGRNDQAFTFEWWGYRGASAGTDEGMFSSITSGGHNGLQIYMDGSADKPRITPRPLGSDGDGTAQIATGAWKHIAVTGKPDGSTTGTWYTNGAANGTWTLNNSSFTSGDSSQVPALCTPSASGGVEHFQSGSRLAIVRIYDRILTLDEVNQNFNAERGRFGI